eukprot:gene8201-biopygen8281
MLGKLGVGAVHHLEHILEGDADKFIWMNAAWTLQEIGGLAARHVKIFAAQLNHHDEGVTCCALDMLGELGEPAAQHVGEIIRLMKNTDTIDVQEAAVNAMRSLRLGEHAVPHLDEVAALLEDDDQTVKKTAVEILGEMGKHAAPHVEAIFSVLQSVNYFVQKAVVDALWRLKAHAVPSAKAVMVLLEHGDWQVKTTIAMQSWRWWTTHHKAGMWGRM